MPSGADDSTLGAALLRESFASAVSDLLVALLYGFVIAPSAGPFSVSLPFTMLFWLFVCALVIPSLIQRGHFGTPNVYSRVAYRHLGIPFRSSGEGFVFFGVLLRLIWR